MELPNEPKDEGVEEPVPTISLWGVVESRRVC